MNPFLLFKALAEFRKYSFPADIWSLGALIAFRCNAKHLFWCEQDIHAWTKRNVLPDHFTKNLKDLVASMLDPSPRNRPSADDILKEV